MHTEFRRFYNAVIHHKRFAKLQSLGKSRPALEGWACWRVGLVGGVGLVRGVGFVGRLGSLEGLGLLEGLGSLDGWAHWTVGLVGRLGLLDSWARWMVGLGVHGSSGKAVRLQLLLQALKIWRFYCWE